MQEEKNSRWAWIEKKKGKLELKTKVKSVGSRQFTTQSKNGTTKRKRTSTALVGRRRRRERIRLTVGDERRHRNERPRTGRRRRRRRPAAAAAAPTADVALDPKVRLTHPHRTESIEWPTSVLFFSCVCVYVARSKSQHLPSHPASAVPLCGPFEPPLLASRPTNSWIT